MKKKKIAVAGLTVLTLLLTSGVIAFAANDTAVPPVKGERSSIFADFTDAQKEAVQQARIESEQEAVASLLEKEILTQNEADAVLSHKGRPSPDMRSDLRNTLTKDQRDALQQEIKDVRDASIAEMVSNGTLTQEQANQMPSQKRAKPDSLNFTEEQKSAVMQMHQNSIQTAISNLVERGIITQNDANLIARGPSKAEPPKAASEKQQLTEDQKTALQDAVQSMLKNKLSSLAKAGTITQDQADQLLSLKEFHDMRPMPESEQNQASGTECTE